MMNKRYRAHIVIETQTPLKMGSNAMDFLQDSPVQKDWNGLPMILGTSIAGVLRKEFHGDKAADVFGLNNGSKIIISNALLIADTQGMVYEDLCVQKSDFLKLFENLPLREHTKITSKGTTQKGAKFDEEVVFKGTRFKFSIEFIDNNKELFMELIGLLRSSNFRLGGGSTKGFGKFKMIEIEYGLFDIEKYSSSLNKPLGGDKECNLETITCKDYTPYILQLKPDDFFMFGSGFSDNDADMTPVYEQVIDYEKRALSEKKVLIPASSIKGALAHRTTYHYNKLHGNTIEAGNGVDSVSTLFGAAKNSKQNIDGAKGKILITDCFKNDHGKTKTFDHVSIDRFTGGAMEGALFQEKTVANDEKWYEIELLVHSDIQGKELEAFELALKDVTTGMLPLGGATTKGHGIFLGTITKNGVAL